MQTRNNTRYPRIILLQVSGDYDPYWGFYPPLGLASIATYALQNSHIPKDNFLILDTTIPLARQIIQAFDPDIIGFSTFSKHYQETVEYAKMLRRKKLKSFFIIGGVHISLFPDTLDPVFDLAVNKEGEQTFLEILRVWPHYSVSGDTSLFRRIPSVIYRKQGTVIRNSERAMIYPVDKIPPINWSLFFPIYFRHELIKDNETQTWKHERVFPLFTTRGCPYNCVFCARTALWKGIRFFSESHVAEEIQALYKTQGIKTIQIWDDLFVLNIHRLKQIEKVLRRHRLLKTIAFYKVFARANLFTEDMSRQLKKLNVKSVQFGFESGSDKILTFLKRDTVHVIQNYEAASLCEKEKIGFVACLMLGTPHETPADMKKTLDFVDFIRLKTTLESIDLARTTAFPETALYDYVVSHKLLPSHYQTLSKSLALSDATNTKPLFLKTRKQTQAYEHFWQIIKSHEKDVDMVNSQQKGFRKARMLMHMYNQISRITFVPWFLGHQVVRGNWSIAVKLLYYSILHELGIARYYFMRGVVNGRRLVPSAGNVV